MSATTTTPHPHPPRDHCLAPTRTVDAPLGHGGQYGRLFPDLPELECDDQALLALGDEGGVCDSASDCPDGTEAAGWPVFGQFIAHDITADRSPLALRTDPNAIENFRTPRANLESMYGAGPGGAPFLYDVDDSAKLLVGENELGRPDDLARNRQGVALLGDPRNDVHLLMSQLHLAFVHAHNALVDRLREDGVAEGELFEQAERAMRWHYQWLIVNDYLPSAVGPELMADLLDDGPRFYRPDGDTYLPVEFADAAFRYGHSQIRERYRLNDQSDDFAIFPDLVGFRPVPAERVVDWAYLFDLPDRPAAQRSKRIDGRLASGLIQLPRAVTGDVEVHAYHSLAGRDLQRSYALGLPSGEEVSRAMGIEPLTPEETGMSELGWTAETPIWLYFLKEAEAKADGQRLGPAGGRIVAEVLLGIIDADPGSYRSVDPHWQPTLPAAGDKFDMGDLLAFARTKN
jgi:Animal haem peroxidase